jgi:glycosyltransferase involved in cell wall biosynthesis
VNDRKLGWITGIDNIDEVAEKLTATYHAQEERLRISQEARNVINNDFNETKLALDYVELYENSK